MDKLEKCPFCGEEKRLKLVCKSTLEGFNGLELRVERHTWSVRCQVCKARGGTAGGKVIPYFDFFIMPYENKGYAPWQTDDETLRQKAISAWNRRANDA